MNSLFHASEPPRAANRSPGPWVLRVAALAALLLLVGCRDESSTRPTSPGFSSPNSANSGAEEFEVFDLAGQPVNPFHGKDSRANVFIFVGLDCPISNHYAPAIRRLEEKYARSGVSLWLVYADADTTPAAIRAHLKEYELAPAALRDPKHCLVRLARVHVTPEAAVFLPGQRLVYHGRIDDRYADFGKERPEATKHDLEDVLEAILHGRPIPFATRRAVGCYIPDLK
jgi:hypothetical protein